MENQAAADAEEISLRNSLRSMGFPDDLIRIGCGLFPPSDDDPQQTDDGRHQRIVEWILRQQELRQEQAQNSAVLLLSGPSTSSKPASATSGNIGGGGIGSVGGVKINIRKVDSSGNVSTTSISGPSEKLIGISDKSSADSEAEKLAYEQRQVQLRLAQLKREREQERLVRQQLRAQIAEDRQQRQQKSPSQSTLDVPNSANATSASALSPAVNPGDSSRSPVLRSGPSPSSPSSPQTATIQVRIRATATEQPQTIQRRFLGTDTVDVVFNWVMQEVTARGATTVGGAEWQLLQPYPRRVFTRAADGGTSVRDVGWCPSVMLHAVADGGGDRGPQQAPPVAQPIIQPNVPVDDGEDDEEEEDADMNHDEDRPDEEMMDGGQQLGGPAPAVILNRQNIADAIEDRLNQQPEPQIDSDEEMANEADEAPVVQQNRPQAQAMDRSAVLEAIRRREQRQQETNDAERQNTAVQHRPRKITRSLKDICAGQVSRLLLSQQQSRLNMDGVPSSATQLILKEWVENKLLDRNSIKLLARSCLVSVDLDNYVAASDTLIHTLVSSHSWSIERLSLKGTVITDFALRAIGELSMLHDLDISFCRITDDGIKHLKNLSQLRILNLTNTKITSASIKLIGEKASASLEELYISGCNLHDPNIFRYIAPIEGLRKLAMANVQIPGNMINPFNESPRAFSNCRTLHIGLNEITDDDLIGLIGRFRALTDLDLQGCRRCTEAGLIGLLQAGPRFNRLIMPQKSLDMNLVLPYLCLHPLQELDLGNCTTMSPESAQHLSRLRDYLLILRLERTWMNDDALVHIGQLRKLVELHLDGTSITDNGLVSLNHLENLEILSLSDVKLTDKAFKAWAEEPPVFAPRLKQLNLSRTQITNDSAKHLAIFINLNLLNVLQTQVHREVCQRALFRCVNLRTIRATDHEREAALQEREQHRRRQQRGIMFDDADDDHGDD